MSNKSGDLEEAAESFYQKQSGLEDIWEAKLTTLRGHNESFLVYCSLFLSCDFVYFSLFSLFSSLFCHVTL